MSEPKRVAWNRKCVCGHRYIEHAHPGDVCGVPIGFSGWATCECARFRPAKVKRGR